MDRLYFEPATVDEATALATEHGSDACFVAGGTDLVVRARKERGSLPRVLISLHRLPALRELSYNSNGSLRIGAAISHAVLTADSRVAGPYTAISDGAALVGSPATRHVGTLGGNLCNASPANDTGSALLCFNASVDLASSRGLRSMPLSEFFVGPGVVRSDPDELLVAVNLAPPAEALGCPPEHDSAIASAYIRLHYRQAMEIAVVGAAAALGVDEEGLVAAAAVALTAAAPTCLIVPAVGDFLAGRYPDAAALREAGQLAAQVARPIDDVRASADYRAAMVQVVVRRALACALRRAAGAMIAVPATLHASLNGTKEATS